MVQDPNAFEDDGFWDVGTAPAPASAAGGGDVRAAYEAAGGTWDKDAEQGLAYRQSVGQTPEQIRANMTQEAKDRFTQPAGGGGGGSFTFANPQSSAPAAPAPFGSFAFDPSKFGQTEGFKFKLDKAMQAIGRLGAAKGTYFNPQTTAAAQREAVGLANQDINDEFVRQGGVYDRNAATHMWNEGSRFGAQRSNRLDDYSMMDTDRRFSRGVLESDRDFGYRGERDRVGDLWRFVDYGNQSVYAR